LRVFTVESFRGALDQDFVLHTNTGQGLGLKLIRVQELPPVSSRIPGDDHTPFTAYFRGPRTPWARQHTYCLANEALGEIHIFLVPIGPDGEGMIYEAVFT
jgi:hypothetical protein